MADVRLLMQTLQERGVTFTLEEGRLHVEGPEDVLTDPVLAHLGGLQADIKVVLAPTADRRPRRAHAF